MGIAPLLLSDDLDLFHDNRRAGLVVPVGGNVGDLIDDLNAVHNMAKGGVATVQMRGILVHDEKLAAGGVRVHRAGHADDTAGVLDGVGNAVLQELSNGVPDWFKKAQERRRSP